MLPSQLRSFTLVAARAMGAIHICVLVKCELVDHISDVNTAHISCGIGNVMYNKVCYDFKRFSPYFFRQGAVGVSMRLFDTSIAFICAHLAANREKIAERNNDFHRIASQIVEGLTSKNGGSLFALIVCNETQLDQGEELNLMK